MLKINTTIYFCWFKRTLHSLLPSYLDPHHHHSCSSLGPWWNEPKMHCIQYLVGSWNKTELMNEKFVYWDQRVWKDLISFLIKIHSDSINAMEVYFSLRVFRIINYRFSFIVKIITINQSSNKLYEWLPQFFFVFVVIHPQFSF